MTVKRNQIGVLFNGFQGEHKKVLTLCSAGCLRSPTAAHILSSEPFNFNTRCAGLSEEYAIIPVTDALLLWADEIVVMDMSMAYQVRSMLERLSHEFASMVPTPVHKPVHVLHIEDDYSYREPALVAMMVERFEEIFNKK